MTQEQHDKFKEGAKKFYKALEPLLRNIWDDSNKNTLIGVLLQNIAFNSKGTSNYSFEEDLKRTNELLNAIGSLARYENYHLFNYIYTELDMIYTGILISDEYD